MIIKKIMITMTMSCTLVYAYNIESVQDLQEVLNARAVQQIYTILSEKNKDDKNLKTKLIHATDRANIALDFFKAQLLEQGGNDNNELLTLALKEQSQDALLQIFSSPRFIFQVSGYEWCANISNNHLHTNPLCNELRNDVFRALTASHK